MRLTTLVIVGILSANAIGQNPIKLGDAALTSEQRRDIATKGKQVSVPSESLLEFRLQQPVSLPTRSQSLYKRCEH
jgi:hypothetical protein